MDHATKSSIGLGFVTFADPSAAVKAYEGLDKTSFQGRLLHILPAMERSGSTSKAPYDEFGKVDVRGEREKQRKDTAGKEFNWSMLYMNVRQCCCFRVQVLMKETIERRSGFFRCRSHEHLKGGYPKSRHHVF